MANTRPRIFADFNNSDGQGRLRLSTHGAEEDMRAQQVELQEGMEIIVYDEEFVTDAVVRWGEEGEWVAEIDWEALRR